MTTLRVTTAESSLNGLTCQLLMDWAMMSWDVTLQPLLVELESPYWNFSAVSSQPGNLTDMLQASQDGLLRCKGKTLIVTLEPKTDVLVLAKLAGDLGDITDVTSANSLINHVEMQLDIKLERHRATSHVQGCFVFKMPDGACLDNVLTKVSIMSCGMRYDVIFEKYVEPCSSNTVAETDQPPSCGHAKDDLKENCFTCQVYYNMKEEARLSSVPSVAANLNGQGYNVMFHPAAATALKTPPPGLEGHDTILTPMTPAVFAKDLTSHERHPLTRIEIFHDGENCPIPDSEMVCDNQGLWMMANFEGKWRPRLRAGPARPIQFDVLKDKLFRRFIECKEGPGAAAGRDITSVDFVWNFVMNPDHQGGWFPHKAVMSSMLVSGVTPVNPGPKKGAVDIKLKEMLTKAEKVWRHRVQAEKDGLLIVLISGDSDFANEIRELRKTTPISKGVDVCIVYSQNAPAKKAFLSLTSPDMIIDEWNRMVEDSRLRIEDVQNGAGHAGPSGEVVVKTTFPKIVFLRSPGVLRDLSNKLQDVHEAFSACLSNQCVQVVSHKEIMPAPTEEEKKRARIIVSDFLEEIKDDKFMVVPGVTTESLRSDSTLRALSHMHKVTVYFPSNNIGGAPARPASTALKPLQANEVYVSSNMTDDEVKQYISRRYKVTIFAITTISSNRVAKLHVVVHKADLLEAKAKLLRLCSGTVRCSLKPFEIKAADQEVQLQMRHPKLWKDVELKAFRNRNNVLIKFQPESKQYQLYASNFITCKQSEVSKVMGTREAGVSFQRLATAARDETTESSAGATVMLLWHQENVGGVSTLEDYLLSLGVDTRLVPLLQAEPRYHVAEWNLLKSVWSPLVGKLKSLGVQDVSVDETSAKAQIVGKVQAVKQAGDALQELVNDIQVCVVEGISELHKYQHLLQSYHEFTSSKIKEKYFGYFINKENGAVRLAYFPEHSEDVPEIVEELNNFRLSYKEVWWTMPADVPQTRDLWKADYAKVLQKNHNLAFVPTWSGNFLLLGGKAEDVDQAFEWLTQLCQPEQSKTYDVELTQCQCFLLRHKLNLADKNRFYKYLEDVCRSAGCRWRRLEKGFGLKVFRITGPAATVDQTEIGSASVVKLFFQQNIRTCAVEMEASKAAFLQNSTEGKQIMGKVSPNGVWWEWSKHVGDSSLLGSFRLPNGCVVEVREGNAVTGGLGIAALVNSANGQLLRGEVAGIAGAIKAKGGPGLVAECNNVLQSDGGADIPVGTVVVTGAHGLESCGFTSVIHAVPPVYSERTLAGQQMEATVSAILECQVKSVVMPVLGAGIFGWSSDLPAVIGHILNAIAKYGAHLDWGASTASSSSLERIVIMDLNLGIVQEVAQKVLDFDDLDVSPKAQVRPRPVFKGPTLPQHRWEYDCSDAGQGWIPYDYDQTLQLDQALSSEQTVILLCGDRNRKPSDSRNVEDGHTYPTYDVDFSKHDQSSCATQFNRKSKYPRRVRRFGLSGLQEALDLVPLFSEIYQKAQQDFLEDVSEWEEQHAEMQCEDEESTNDNFQDAVEDSQPPPLMRKSSFTRRFFTHIADEEAEVTLELSSFGAAADQVKETLVEDIQSAELMSPSMTIKALLSDEPFEDAVSQFEDSLLRAGVKFVQLDIDVMNGSFVIRTMGKENLLIAKSQFDAWNSQRIIAMLEESAASHQVQHKVQYPCGAQGEEWFKWDSITTDDEIALCPISEDTDEYQNVVQLMRDETGLGTAKNVWTRKITKIERVVNVPLWRSYYFFCQYLKTKPRNKGSANELWVKPGTCSMDPLKICSGEADIDENYSRGYSMFGKATYTAENAAYLDDRRYCYDLPDSESRQMFLCRFAAGTVLEMTYGEASQKLFRQPKEADSVRGDVVPGSNFFALMSYTDYQVYPAYLVTFLKR